MWRFLIFGLSWHALALSREEKHCAWLISEIDAGKKAWLSQQSWFPRLEKSCKIPDLSSENRLNPATEKKCKWLKEEISGGKKQWLQKQTWYGDLAMTCGFQSVNVQSDDQSDEIDTVLQKRCAWLNESMAMGFEDLYSQDWYPKLAFACGFASMQALPQMSETEEQWELGNEKEDAYLESSLTKKCTWLHENMAKGEEKLYEQEWYPKLAVACGLASPEAQARVEDAELDAALVKKCKWLQEQVQLDESNSSKQRVEDQPWFPKLLLACGLSNAHNNFSMPSDFNTPVTKPVEHRSNLSDIQKQLKTGSIFV